MRATAFRIGAVAWAGLFAVSGGAAEVSVPNSVTAFTAPGTARETLTIYGATDLFAAEPLIQGFQALNRDTTVIYVEYNTNELYETFRAEADADRSTADLLMSSAADLQIKLVNDGYALRHESLETSRLPSWAKWRNEAFGFTFEPAVIVYDPERLPPEDVPRSRFDMVRLLRERGDRYIGRIGTYDISESGIGFLFATHDALQASTYWRLIESFGRSHTRLFRTTADILDAIEDGEVLIGYNLLGSYARARIERGARLAMVLPEDYTLVMSRTVFIPKVATNPSAARRFVDFLLSINGQEIIASRAYLYSVRSVVAGPATAAALRAASAGPIRPIALGPGLLVYLDQIKRKRFLEEWLNTVPVY